MQDTVLRKLDMDRSTYEQPLPSRMTDNASSAYKKGATIPGKYHTYPEMAAAGLWTNASDLARFGIETMKSAQGRSNKVLSQAMTRQMLTKEKDNYALGLGIEAPATRQNLDIAVWTKASRRCCCAFRIRERVRL